MGSLSSSTALCDLFAAIDDLRQVLSTFLQNRAASAGEGVERGAAPLLRMPSALMDLADRFGLSTFEQCILLLCAALELAPDFEGLCLQIHNHPQRNYPTLALALMVLPGADVAVLSPESPLHRWQLVEMGEGHIFTQLPLRLHRRILCFLLGQGGIDPALAGLWQPLTGGEGAGPLVPSHQHCVDQVVQGWARAEAGAIQLTGMDRSALQAIALAACEALGWKLALLSPTALPLGGAELQRIAQLCTREGQLQGAALLVDGHDLPSDDGRGLGAVRQFAAAVAMPLVLCGPEGGPALARSPLMIAVPTPTPAEQITLWRRYLGDRAATLNGQVAALVAQFSLGAGAIQAACRQLPPSVETGDATGNDVTFEQLWQFCRGQARPQLDDLAQRIDCHATWDELVLAEDKKTVLRHLVNQTRYRAQVYEEWGFARKSDRGLGISALFAGQRALARNQDLAIVKGLLLRFVPCNARDARVCKSSSKASTPSKTAPLCNDIDASRVASASTNAAAPPWPVCAVQPKWSATPLEPAQKGWEPEPQGAPLANLTPRSCGGSSAWPVKPSIGPRPHPSVAT